MLAFWKHELNLLRGLLSERRFVLAAEVTWGQESERSIVPLRWSITFSCFFSTIFWIFLSLGGGTPTGFLFVFLFSWHKVTKARELLCGVCLGLPSGNCPDTDFQDPSDGRDWSIPSGLHAGHSLEQLLSLSLWVAYYFFKDVLSTQEDEICVCLWPQAHIPSRNTFVFCVWRSSKAFGLTAFSDSGWT